MILTFLAGLVMLLISLALQTWFASAGIFLNFSFVALISLAFVFEFWELLLLVLLAVFIVNWQPSVSVEILVFALYPIAVYFFRKTLMIQHWVTAPAMIVIGFLVLYLSVAPGRFFADLPSFLLNVAVGLVFGAMIFFPVRRWGR
jgi:hypothetical protein